MDSSTPPGLMAASLYLLFMASSFFALHTCKCHNVLGGAWGGGMGLHFSFHLFFPADPVIFCSFSHRGTSHRNQGNCRLLFFPPSSPSSLFFSSPLILLACPPFCVICFFKKTENLPLVRSTAVFFFFFLHGNQFANQRGVRQCWQVVWITLL